MFEDEFMLKMNSGVDEVEEEERGRVVWLRGRGEGGEGRRLYGG